MIFKEAVGWPSPGEFLAANLRHRLDHDAIDKARGLPENIAADVSEERLKRFFAREGRGYRVHKEIARW
jgi:two-component system CheB/CheR fusion protein